MEENLSKENQSGVKKSHRGLWITIIVIAVMLGAGYLFTLGERSPKESGSGASEIEETDNSGSQEESVNFVEEEASTPDEKNENADTEEQVLQEPKTHAVTYSSTGFSPSAVTIKAGDIVTWTNKSSSNMWVATAIHPSHAVYDGTSIAEHCPAGDSFDQCESGDLYSFTFTKEGTWKYHNHDEPRYTGTVIVE